ncbi:hypothetical protein D3C75_547720 [compost metagenome]
MGQADLLTRAELVVDVHPFDQREICSQRADFTDSDGAEVQLLIPDLQGIVGRHMEHRRRTLDGYNGPFYRNLHLPVAQPGCRKEGHLMLPDKPLLEASVVAGKRPDWKACAKDIFHLVIPLVAVLAGGTRSNAGVSQGSQGHNQGLVGQCLVVHVLQLRIILILHGQKSYEGALPVFGQLGAVHHHIQRLQRLILLLQNMALVAGRHHIGNQEGLSAPIQHNLDAVIPQIQASQFH